MPQTEYDIVEENKLLLILYQEYGYDFSEYSPSHIKRRIKSWMVERNIKNVKDACLLIKSSKQAAESLIAKFSISITEMFRDPKFFKAFRQQVVPVLKTYPFIKIWHAGCATGEEVYSMAILMQEEGLYKKCRIFGTDFNEGCLQTAKNGVYSNDLIRKYTANYVDAGGKQYFSNYFNSKYGSVIMNQEIKKNIVWGNHNLVTDAVFSEVDVILCRNVLIYFNKDMHNKSLELFRASLSDKGFLCLGTKETLMFSSVEKDFDVVSSQMRIYKSKS